MPPPNPYVRAVATATAAREKENGAPQVNNNNNMGPQSQRRLTLNERTHQLQSQSHRKKQKTGGQQTLFGGSAFEPVKDCEVCKAKQWGRIVHRAHHKLCNNRRGGAKLSTAAMTSAQEEKRLQVLFATPLTEAEKCSGKHLTKEAVAGYFAPREVAKFTATTTTTTTTTTVSMETDTTTKYLTADEMCLEGTRIVKDPDYAYFHDSRAPAAMLAFAKVVVERIINNKHIDITSHFDGITITVPLSKCTEEPQFHSIVGQKLLHVDWKRHYNLDVTCPRCRRCHMKNTRTNYSKNKILFPLFGLEGPPQWCMVQSLKCPSCKVTIQANSGEILRDLPAYIRLAYPVETKYAMENKLCHLSKSVTNAMDLLMPTYGNGDLISRLLYNAINRSYIERLESYYSSYKRKEGATNVYLEKDGEYVKAYPPLGDAIRDTYDAASLNANTCWGISDHQRHTREMQSVTCGLIFAQDHTHEVTKNYFHKKTLGATALWDVSTETGEIAAAVLVPSTKTIHFSHAASALSRREAFSPKAMYSDTWPAKTEYWNSLFKSSLEGRLGLFHYTQRITKTLKKNHVDHFTSLNGLLNCIYHYNVDDHENLLRALKEGTLSSKYTDDEIQELRGTKAFRQRYDRYLRKEIRTPHILCSMLDDWYDRFKCSASEGSRPARGRRDPNTGETLFTSETKEASRLAKVNAKYLQDPLPLDQMYFVIQPNPNAEHQLKEYLSRRGESSLESFYLMLAHFGNCGMRTSLADNLNLTGTARHNMSIRHKLKLTSLTPGSRKKIPAGYEYLVPYFNHSELAHVNRVAAAAGTLPQNIPFKQVEKLNEDNGERFFSEYITEMNKIKPRYDLQSSRCLCDVCNRTNAAQLPPPTPQQPQQQPTVRMTPPVNSNIHKPTPAAAPASPKIKSTTTVHQANTSVHPNEQVMRILPRQQQQQPQPQPQPQQQHVMIQPQLHQHSATPMMMGGYHQQTFTPYQPWIAQTYPFVMPTPPAAMFCCPRYMHWHTAPNRRGRPPHDDHCHVNRRRMGKREKNRLDNPCCGVI